MDLRHLEQFVAVADTGSFTRAAGRLHLVQSGVSATVKALEAEVGAALFERTSRRVVLTAEGESLLPAARAALDAVEEVRDRAAAFHGGVRGTVAVGLLMAPDVLDFPGLVGRFHADYPEVRIELRVSPTGTAGLIEGILAESIDLAVLILSEPEHPGLELDGLVTGVSALAVRSDDPLASAPEVRLRDLVGRDFIDGPTGWGNRAVVDRVFARAGLERRVVVEVGDPGVQLGYVREGLGIAFIARVTAERMPGIALVDVVDAEPRWYAMVATKKGRRQGVAVQRLASLLLEQARRVALPA